MHIQMQNTHFTLELCYEASSRYILTQSSLCISIGAVFPSRKKWASFKWITCSERYVSQMGHQDYWSEEIQMSELCSELNQRMLEGYMRMNQRMDVGRMYSGISTAKLSIRWSYPVSSIDEALPQKRVRRVEIKLRSICHSAQGFCSGTPALVHS